MLYTTGPAFLISLVIYFIIGFQFKGGDVDTTAVNTILGGLQKSFKIVSAQGMSSLSSPPTNVFSTFIF